jgi:hypothetical protein
MEPEGDVLVFNPATELQVLEEFEFDEMIQRPEEIRFFTLQEQTTDLFEKLLPRTGNKLAKGVLRRAEAEVEAFTRLYTSYIRETPTGFEETPVGRPTRLPWVHYANSGPKTTTPFSWSDSWLPLFADGRGLQANYYFQLLDSLPKRGVYYAGGEGQALYPAMINDVIALGPATYTKTAYREDGTFRIQTVSRPDTQDTATFTGYTLDVPNPRPPNPLEGHPFLGSREVPFTLESTEPLPVLLPSLEAIFEHGVPRTTNPYKDAPPYLKLYDIRLSQVPWKEWKANFPPAELVEVGAPPLDIPFKVGEEDAPSSILTDVYRSKWYPGLSTRYWLSKQLDGGVLVSKILLSQAGTHGPIAIPPPVQLPAPEPIEGSAEDCLPSEITDFDDFASRGVYRSPRCVVCGWYGHGATDCPDRKSKVTTEYKPGGGCLPLALIAKEREEAPFEGKQPWTPGTDAAILSDYQALLKTHAERQQVERFEKPPVADPSAPPSETRELILAVLKDDQRLPEDKAADIQILIGASETPITLKDNLFLENGQFVLCSHTLELLGGAYERDAAAFLLKWAADDAGFKTCKVCGERIESILQVQDQYDENGRLIQTRSAFTKPTFSGDEHLSFAASLKQLQTLFNTDSPAEDVFYLLLSLLQILPEEEQLKPILDTVRSETAKLMARVAGKALNAKQQGDVNMAAAVFGFNGVVLLLQLHKPQLVPRRSFGSRPLVLRGYPRDTEDVNDAPILDALLGVLQQTFEAYPSTFRGSSVVFLRNILNNRKSVRTVIVSSMTRQFVPLFRDALQRARDTVVPIDVALPIQNAFSPPVVRPAKDVGFLAPSDTVATQAQSRFRCKDLYPPWLVPSMPFSFRQEDLKITTSIRPKASAEDLQPPEELPLAPAPVAADIRRRLQDAPPAFKPLRKVLELSSPEMLRTVLLSWMTIVGQNGATTPGLKAYIRRMRPQVEQAYMDPSTLRDYFKGVLVELSAQIAADGIAAADVERAMSEDLTLRSLFAKVDESRRVVDTLKARERETFKERMRRLPDAQREITKTLITLGVAPYLITRDDREAFVRQMQEELEQVELRPPAALGEEVDEAEVPEEGPNADRDGGPQGEPPVDGEGNELENDYGDYGDRRARNADGEEYEENRAFDFEDAAGF